METANASAYFRSNTGYRFISEGVESIKIQIPKPAGGFYYKSIGHKKMGLDKALKVAISERNKQGKKLWKGFWEDVLTDWTLLARLPRSLEPVFGVRSNKKKLGYEYRVSWNEYRDGKLIKVFRRFSCEVHGKLGAYSLAKQSLQTAFRDKLDLLNFMGRGSIVSLK